MMGRRSPLALWLVMPGLVAACAIFPSPALVTPGPPSSQVTGDLRTFDEGGLTFAYPAAWQDLHFSVNSSFSHLIAMLATVPVPDPCATKVTASFTETDCANRFALTPDSLVVQVSEVGMPGFDIHNVPTGASTITVDGQPGYVRDATSQELASSGPAGGADLIRTWTITNPGALDNGFEIDAYLRGPNLGPIESQLGALVASLRYDPPASPAPSNSPGSATLSSAPVVPMDIRFGGTIGCASFPYGCTATLSVLDPNVVVTDAWRPPSSDPWWAPDWSAGTQASHFEPTPVGTVPGVSPGRHQLVVSLLGSSDVPSYNPDGGRAFDLVGRCSAEVDVPVPAEVVNILVTFVPNGANFQTACSLEAAPR